ncbi:MAG: CoA-binding protein, partial [Acidimicrobiia bacterium]
SDIDEPVDLTILAVADHRLEELLDNALSAGTRSAVIFSPALGAASTGVPLRERLAEMAQEAAIPICGPNGMGFLNLDHSLRVCGFFQPWELEAGPVTFLSHSGSLFSAVIHNHRDLRFNLVVSSGLELVVTMDQYLAHAVEQPTTRVVGLFLETVRRPVMMAAALTLAGARDIPVVALKVGRSERGREAAATHSGALAGEEDVHRAFFEAHGVHQVDTMAEMMDTLEVFTTSRRARIGGLGSVHDSGGERTMLLDHAETIGVPLAKISEPTRGRLTQILEPGLEPDNPVDAWGTGHDAEEVFGETLRILASDPEVGLLAFAVDLTAEEDPGPGYVDLLADLNKQIEVPLVVLSNLGTGIDPIQAVGLRRQGIPVLEGTETGLKAIGHALAHVKHRPVAVATTARSPALFTKWRDRLTQPQPLFEQESLALIADYGIPVVQSVTAGSLDEAVAA